MNTLRRIFGWSRKEDTVVWTDEEKHLLSFTAGEIAFLLGRAVKVLRGVSARSVLAAGDGVGKIIDLSNTSREAR